MTHLAAGTPEGAKDGREVTPTPLAQGLDEGCSLAFGDIGAYDVELCREFGIRLRVIPNGISNMQHDGLCPQRTP